MLGVGTSQRTCRRKIINFFCLHADEHFGVGQGLCGCDERRSLFGGKTESQDTYYAKALESSVLFAANARELCAAGQGVAGATLCRVSFG